MQGPNLNWGVQGREKHPANGVTWYDAKQYCEWKGKRLPTEAEWELAARGTDGRMFAWGNDKPTCAHVVSNSCGGGDGTRAVGSKPLGDSPYGLHDMGGNVLEWCADYYKEDYSPRDEGGVIMRSYSGSEKVQVYVHGQIGPEAPHNFRLRIITATGEALGLPLHERRQRPHPLLAALEELREVPTHQHRRVALVELE